MKRGAWGVRCVRACAIALVLARPKAAHAYTFESLLYDGCHERITQEGLRRVRSERGMEWKEPRGEDDALIDDLPFRVDGDLRDFGTASLLLAVREVDLNGRDPTEFFELAELHGTPSEQVMHCLRNPEDDGDEGARAALARCRAHIANEFRLALASRNSELRPTRAVSYALPTALGTRGKTRVEIPRSYYHLGRALHALQDSFTHTYRSYDGKEVHTVLNWVDRVHPQYSATRDGPEHRFRLDACDDGTERRRNRRLAATDASAELLRAWELPDAEANASLTRSLDVYLAMGPSCSVAPDDCVSEDDPDTTGSGCRASSGGSSWSAGALGLLMAAVFFRRSRRGGRRGRMLLPSLTALLVAGAVCGEREARADDSVASRLGASVAFSASLDRPAFAGALGFRIRANDHWVFGLDSEWNPWISLQRTELRTGVLNQSVVSILRFDLGPVALRGTVRLGASVLLYDLYGAPAGSVGPYLGVSLLGLEVPLGNRFRFLVDPADVAVAVPSLHGAPLVHRQYRLTVGLQWGT